MSTLAELIAQVRGEVRDPNGDRWTDADITIYLNQAQLLLAQGSRKRQLWTSSVTAGTASVAMPDMLAFREVAWETSAERYGLKMKHGMPRVQPSEQGFPDAVYRVGDSLYLDPVPSSAGTLLISGIERPTAMSDSEDTPDVDDGELALVACAVWRCLLSDGDPTAAERKSEWEQARLE